MFPDVPIISINIGDFEKATYYNKSMVWDKNPLTDGLWTKKNLNVR